VCLELEPLVLFLGSLHGCILAGHSVGIQAEVTVALVVVYASLLLVVKEILLAA